MIVHQASNAPFCTTITMPADTNAHKLSDLLKDNASPALAAGRPCMRVLLAAPTAKTPGGQVNADVVLVGGADCQNVELKADGSTNRYVHWSHTDAIYLRQAAAGQKVEVQVE